MLRHVFILPIILAAADPTYLTDAQNCSQQVCLQGTFVAKLQAHSNLQCMEVCGAAHHGFKSVGMGKCTHFTFSPAGECLIYSSCTLGTGPITFGSGSSQYTLTDTAEFRTCLSPWSEKVVDDWVLVAAHNAKMGWFPRDVKNTFKYNENDPENPLYMAVGNMDPEAWKGDDGKYHLKLYFFDNEMEDGDILEWKQSNWISAEWPADVEKISPDNLLTARGGCDKFSGVGVSGDGCAVLDGNGRHGCWFHAIGSSCQWGGHQKFPGFNHVARHQMKLFVWGDPANM